MAHAKDKYYWTQLRAALTAGEWGAQFPAKSPKGDLLSWSELLRKFNKHCKGHQDVAEIASQTQALALQLAAATDLQDAAFDADLPSPYGPLALGDDYVLLEERVPEAKAGYNQLRGLNTTNHETLKLAMACYAYAISRPEECLQYISEVPNLTDIQTRAAPASLRSTAPTLGVPATRSDTPTSSRTTGSFVSADSSHPDISDGRSWASVEAIRSICLQGMCHEKLSPKEPSKALSAYLPALPLLSNIVSEMPRPSPSTASTTGPGKLEFNSFTRYRELWRWVERLLWRAIIITARVGDGQTLWKLLKQYTASSAHWPATFRTEHRSTIATLHLRTFVLDAPPPPAYASSKPPAWLAAARSVIQEYRAVLDVSTHFPRAGERNTKVEEFVDLCVAVWEAGGAVGEYAGWVIDVLWWATRLTFNSHRIYRHMARLLYVAGDLDLAKRFLRLYVQVVSKAREASAADREQERQDGVDPARMEMSVDIDTDRNWVQTLVHGARMLCRVAMAASGAQGRDDAREARTLVEKARERLDANDAELVANVDLAGAICEATLACKEQDPRSRSERFANSLALVTKSVEADPCPSAHHHTALALARAGPTLDLARAVEHARFAVEGDANEVRHWHLLGLLLAATGDWRGARSVFDIASAIGEQELSEDENGPAAPDIDGVVSRDFGGSANGNGHIDGLPVTDSPTPPASQLDRLLDETLEHIPPAADLLHPLPDRPRPSRQEMVEHALQLRITQLALAEHVEGPEGAEPKWLELFAWFSEKRGTTSEPGTRRPSTSYSQDTHQQSTQPSEHTRRSLDVRPVTMELATSIPITISPASPAPDTTEFAQDLSVLTPAPSASRMSEKTTDGRGKKVQRMLKNRVNKGQETINTISKKIGSGVTRNGSTRLRRTSSAPNFSGNQHTQFQASSIHSRRYFTPSILQQDPSHTDLPASPTPAPLPPLQSSMKSNDRAIRDHRLLSDLWLTSAATFRRLGKIEQARGAIQEAEAKDENNPAVWVQLGLYYMALSSDRRAMEALSKALFIAPDDVAAVVHLCRLYLQAAEKAATLHRADNVDLAAGMLSEVTRGAGWDVAEAWYFLGKAYGMQGRKDRERECLAYALGLAEHRGVRDIGSAVGWCL